MAGKIKALLGWWRCEECGEEFAPWEERVTHASARAFSYVILEHKDMDVICSACYHEAVNCLEKAGWKNL